MKQWKDCSLDRPFEFLAAYDSVTWMLKMETSETLMDINVLLVSILCIHTMPSYLARNSNGLSFSDFCILSVNHPISHTVFFVESSFQSRQDRITHACRSVKIAPVEKNMAC